MILNGKELSCTKEAMRKYAEPRLVVGQVFELLHSDTSPHFPGIKHMKKGKYIILGVREAYLTKVKGLMSYDIQCFRVGATYIWGMTTTVIDEALDLGLARMVK